MAPPPAATAKAPVRRQAAGSSARSAETGSARRTPLRIVGPHRRRRDRRNPSRLLNVVSASLVLGSLLAVVVAHALLANGQVHLSALQHQLTLEQSSHRQAELAVSELETPSRIVAAASGQLHMVRPTQVVELPYVSLSTPLPTPKVTPGSRSASAAASASASTSPPAPTGTAATTTTAAGGTTQTTTTSTP